MRCITYLAPSIPLEFFSLVCSHAASAVGLQPELHSETRFSGPPPNEPDPFSLDLVDVGFMCTPSYLRLRGAVELLGLAPLPLDARAEGRPVYFSELAVPLDSPARSLADLRGCVWAYNDPTSLSGYYSAVKALAALGLDLTFFGRMVQSGSHLASLRMLASGEAGAAAIDSTVLALRPELAASVRVIETWGPFPIQPIVVRASFDPDARQGIADALLTIAPAGLAEFGFSGFAAVDDAYYEPERELLASLGY